MKRIIPFSIALLLVIAGCSSSHEYAAPDELAALVVDWGDAVNRADGSVIELYQPNGYHVYGDQRIAHDDIVSYLDSGWTGEFLTEPLLVVDEADGRFIVVCGVRNASPSGLSVTSAVNFEIVTTADGDLRFVQTAWLYANE